MTCCCPTGGWFGAGLAGTAGEIPVVPTEMAEGGGSLDFLRAEHGFSALIELRDESGSRRVLFDAGITPDGLIGNLDRLGIAPDTFEAIVFSHRTSTMAMGSMGSSGGWVERMFPPSYIRTFGPDVGS